MHTISPWAGLRLTRLQRGMSEKCLQRFHGFSLIIGHFKLTGRGHQFFQVFDPRQTAFTFFFPEMFDEAAALDHIIKVLIQRQALVGLVHFMDQLQEPLQRAQCARTEQFMLHPSPTRRSSDLYNWPSGCPPQMPTATTDSSRRR